MAKKKINTQDLVAKIERLARGRMTSEPVVELQSFRGLKNKLDPKVLLVIEDDESMRNAIRRIFEPDGFTVKTASDATELSQVLDSTAPDLIMLDVGLPWVNGFELAQILKEHKDLKSIPLLFVSGKTSDEDLKRAFEIGADDYIKKPFEIEGLRKTVMTLLKINEPG